ncbi:LysR family transcriptional regulator [Paracoccus aminophilus]|uniref:Transcriptional regulator, LysR family n=1 Tax=Paracoccus aminophilus JCM 7686 TaxID=1367847 RepID=S5YAW9_PARAH|nr:LysR family transcriptional regulator [Paracoccus aminophilus]AGT08548.1 transcriptional regulator, LysR family [Paracoccus aminophilus JCM 7686]
MDLRFLESFVEVVECGSLAAAARRLNLTPAAIAQRLRGLERELGQALITRVGRTVRPTASGLAVLPFARRLLADAHDLRAIAAHDTPAGELRLGSTATALTGLLPRVIPHLRARWPQVEFFVRPGSSIDHFHAVLTGELDAALIVRPPVPVPKALSWLTLRDEPLVLILPEEMVGNSASEILREAPFIRYDRNQWGGQIVERYLRTNRLKTHDFLELDALDAIAALVSRGAGVSIVPDWAPPWPENLHLRKLPLPDAGLRSVGILWNRSGARSAAVRALVDICRETFLTGPAAVDHGRV